MPKSILIVDDEADVRAVIQLGLEIATDWQILCASSGAEALVTAADRCPDAILLDLMMPDMDGRATLQQLKANPTTKGIPVILVTAKAQAFQQINHSHLAVAAILAKPFRPLKLAAEISGILGW
ncbi:response regulator [Nodosilinea sp. LEGE 06152]|uniref:response regulator n=1 Tax=Nodosilinea sp. LEGE 06152 TaxID=2777966 RepID=UPI001881B6EE|nr:response regulator [Nodosilinea sp. LEGE 06152]MBE9156986.1 response regulator [Nodosilinea sp. LEGE 06152]